MRTSPPAALTANRSRRLPGTRSMSPNEQKITSGREAIAMALSIISSGVTHTGQPGPCTSSIPGGRSSSMPYLTIVCVCPPQTSMMVHGLVVTARRACRSLLAAAGSRYSSRYFMGISRVSAQRVRSSRRETAKTCFASASSIRDRAKPTCTMTYSPTWASGTCSRQTRLKTPPKSTLPMSTSCSR